MQPFTLIMAVSLASASLAGPAFAQTKPAPGSASPQLQIRVCNQSGRDASVAVSYVEVGRSGFANRGWYSVASGACNDIVRTTNSNFYLYADATDGSGRSWSGNFTLCVQYPGPYTFYSSGADRCASGQETRDFVALHTTEPGVYTWTLNP